ncbi:MAG: hypothetical protein WCC27_07745 [Acidobacteriaceae bacterium]
MSNTVVFAGDGGKISIEVFGYERPAAPHPGGDTWDANWLDAKLLAEAGPFRGTFRLALTTPELAGLYRDLEKATGSLSGRVSFKSLEEDLELTISYSERGAAEIAGVLRPGGLSPGVLHFQFQSDQSYLSSSVQELRILIQRFPFRNVPGL